MEMEQYNSSKRSAGATGLRPWSDQSSRIIRVSRASGGKDRHSKVYTAKGVRDRRIRLSLPTAIKFYELQDRLAFEQPSKAIDWLLSVAANAIADLPILDCSFIEQPVVGPGPEPELQPVTKSGSSSSSETGSLLSLSRSDSHKSAREQQAINSQGSFTELLAGGSSSNATAVAVAEMSSYPINFHAPMGMLLSEHPEMQNLSFLQDHQDYNFNFSMYPSLARGTLQSNTPSELPCHHLHRHSTNPPFFLGTPAAPVAAFAQSRFPAGVFRHSDLKEKRIGK